MRKLTVLYDATCAFCIRCRHWIAGQRVLVPIEFVPRRSAEACAQDGCGTR